MEFMFDVSESREVGTVKIENNVSTAVYNFAT